MKSRFPLNESRTARWFAGLALAFSGAVAMAQADPPARAAALSHAEGTVVFAPAGETEWADAALNRPITKGDRLWTDPGARAELHLGSAALQMDSKTFVEVVTLDDEVLQANLNEGAIDARVRQLDGGENFEIDTPQLAFRASQAGDYRIDVDPVTGTTRVSVRSGAATVQGAAGGTMLLQAGQQVAFAGRNLEQVPQATLVEDGFDRWAAARNRAEDTSVSARYVPREVVGYQELDANGTWTVDNDYGNVWYPRVTVADWAPYRYGRWEWVGPWGWTWIDDAPWGFAPFHYGRWATIGSRWAWVPGRIEARPVYSPALVAFVGGGAGSNWGGRGPGIAWYPLAPGEAWRPAYSASAAYLRNANRLFMAGGGFNWNANGTHVHQRRGDAITAVRVEDFSRGRVNTHWTRVNPAEIGRSQATAQAELPRPHRWSETARAAQPSMQPRAAGVMNAFAVRPWQPQRGDEPRRQAPWQSQQQQQQQPAVQRQQQQQQFMQQQAEQQRSGREQQARQAQQVQQQMQERRQREQVEQQRGAQIQQLREAQQQQMQQQRRQQALQQQQQQQQGWQQQRQQQAWQQEQQRPQRAQSTWPQQATPGGWSPAVQRGGEVREQRSQQSGRWQQQQHQQPQQQQRVERAAQGEGDSRGRGHRFFN